MPTLAAAQPSPAAQGRLRGSPRKARLANTTRTGGSSRRLGKSLGRSRQDVAPESARSHGSTRRDRSARGSSRRRDDPEVRDPQSGAEESKAQRQPRKRKSVRDEPGIELTKELLEELMAGANSSEYALDAHNQDLQHLRELHNYPTLRSLDLSYNRLDTIHGIDSLKDLRELKMYHNRLAGITGLEYCPRLERLLLQDNRIDFLPRSALGKQRHLKELRLDRNRLQHLDSLACHSLVTLDVSHNELVSVKGISSLRKLQTLLLADNQLTSLGDIVRCFSLQDLDIRGNQLKNVAKVSNLTNLQTLQVSGNPLKSVERLLDAPLRSLSELHAASLGLEKVAALASLVPQVEVLVLQDNEVASLSELLALEPLTELRELTVEGNPLCDSSGDYVLRICRVLPDLHILDSLQITEVEQPPEVSAEDLAEAQGKPLHSARGSSRGSRGAGRGSGSGSSSSSRSLRRSSSSASVTSQRRPPTPGSRDLRRSRPSTPRGGVRSPRTRSGAPLLRPPSRSGMEKKMVKPEDMADMFASMREKLAATRVAVHKNAAHVVADMGGTLKENDSVAAAKEVISHARADRHAKKRMGRRGSSSSLLDGATRAAVAAKGAELAAETRRRRELASARGSVFSARPRTSAGGSSSAGGESVISQASDVDELRKAAGLAEAKDKSAGFRSSLIAGLFAPQVHDEGSGELQMGASASSPRRVGPPRFDESKMAEVRGAQAAAAAAAEPAASAEPKATATSSAGPRAGVQREAQPAPAAAVGRPPLSARGRPTQAAAGAAPRTRVRPASAKRRGLQAALRYSRGDDDEDGPEKENEGVPGSVVKSAGPLGGPRMKRRMSDATTNTEYSSQPKVLVARPFNPAADQGAGGDGGAAPRSSKDSAVGEGPSFEEVKLQYELSRDDHKTPDSPGKEEGEEEDSSVPALALPSFSQQIDELATQQQGKPRLGGAEADAALVSPRFVTDKRAQFKRPPSRQERAGRSGLRGFRIPSKAKAAMDHSISSNYDLHPGGGSLLG